MFRVRADRRVVGTAVAGVIAVAAAVGIGLGAYSLGSAGSAGSAVEAAKPQTPAAQETTAPLLPAEKESAAEPAPSEPAPSEAAPSTALTLEEAKAVAARAASSPGRVIEWDQDDEPTGLRYDVTLLHDDGTTTDVEVDTVTGQVTSIDHDTDRD